MLEKTPESPSDSKETKPVILREINPSLEGLMLELKFQYFGHLMQTADSLEKSLILGNTEGKRRRGHQRMRWLDAITNAMDMNLGKLRAMVRGREAWYAADCVGLQRVRHNWATEHHHQYCTFFSSY